MRAVISLWYARSGLPANDVQAVKEICSGAPDEMVMQFAVQETRILLTEDKDFGQLVYAGSAFPSR